LAHIHSRKLATGVASTAAVGLTPPQLGLPVTYKLVIFDMYGPFKNYAHEISTKVDNY